MKEVRFYVRYYCERCGREFFPWQGGPTVKPPYVCAKCGCPVRPEEIPESSLTALAYTLENL